MATNSSTKPERAYLSLLIRPEDLAEDDLAQALNKILPADLYTIRLQCKLIPPAILCSLPVHEAHRVVELLRHLGCLAFAPTLRELVALGPTHKIKDISLTANGISFHLWREDEPVIIQPDDIDVLVRTKMSEAKVSPTSAVTALGLSDKHPRVALGGLGMATGGSFGLAVGLYAGRHLGLDPSEPITTIKVLTKLDIHTSNGTVYQIDGDKFGFDILGAKKSNTDLINIDRLCEFFAALAPNAAVDPYFEYFKAPPDHQQLRIPQRVVNQDHPAFAFYSRWAALMYRYLAKTAV